jgi:hypothetical protein
MAARAFIGLLRTGYVADFRAYRAVIDANEEAVRTS